MAKKAAPKKEEPKKAKASLKKVVIDSKLQVGNIPWE